MTYFEAIKNSETPEEMAKFLWFITNNNLYELESRLKTKAPKNPDKEYEGIIDDWWD